MEEKPVEQIINSQIKQLCNAAATCVERGATVAYNAQAHREALKAVKESLRMMFKPQ